MPGICHFDSLKSYSYLTKVRKATFPGIIMQFFEFWYHNAVLWDGLRVFLLPSWKLIWTKEDRNLGIFTKQSNLSSTSFPSCNSHCHTVSEVSRLIPTPASCNPCPAPPPWHEQAALKMHPRLCEEKEKRQEPLKVNFSGIRSLLNVGGQAEGQRGQAWGGGKDPCHSGTLAYF